MDYETIDLQHDGGVSRVILNRPPMNPVSLELAEELVHVLEALAKRDETRCIVITGSGTKAFCAGADLKSKMTDPSQAERFRYLGRTILNTIETHPKPVVAAIRGWCIGGGFALAMACDIRIADDTARFRTADAYIGLVPSWGMSLTRLVHFIGRNHALDMLMLGDDTDALAAKDLGLLTSVTPAADFEAEVVRVSERLASGSPIVFKSIKEACRAQYWHSPEVAREIEIRWAEISAASNDYAEGRKAFAEKRAPVFTGT